MPLGIDAAQRCVAVAHRSKLSIVTVAAGNDADRIGVARSLKGAGSPTLLTCFGNSDG
jgi:hypothetical protein